MPDLIRNASEYLTQLFGPQDHIAITLIHRRFEAALKSNPQLAKFGARLQRTGLAHHFATPKYLGFLHWLNTTGYEIYSTPNTVTPTSHGRKKSDILAVRHLYLDFDEDGESALDSLLAHREIPHPNYIVQTSKGKFQVLWKANSFSVDVAERLLRALARGTGADIAATDVARVLRLPGFVSNKYRLAKHFVTALRFHQGVFTPQTFQHSKPSQPQLVSFLTRFIDPLPQVRLNPAPNSTCRNLSSAFGATKDLLESFPINTSKTQLPGSPPDAPTNRTPCTTPHTLLKKCKQSSPSPLVARTRARNDHPCHCQRTPFNSNTPGLLNDTHL